MTLNDAVERVKSEVEKVPQYYGEVTLRIEAGRVVVIDYHRTEK